MIIYDFDGTLTPSGNADYPIMSEICKCSCKEIHDKAFAISSDLATSFCVAFKNVLNKNGMELNDENVAYGADKIKFNPGVQSFLQYFNEIGLKQFVISQSFVAYIKNTPIGIYLNEVFGATIKNQIGTVPRASDKVKIIEYISNKYSCPIENMIYIGDGYSDKDALEYIKKHGGVSILVCNDELDIDKKVLQDFTSQDIISKAFPKDFRVNSSLYKYVNELIQNK